MASVGLRSQKPLCFLELGLIKDQVFIPALAGCVIEITHVMYIILPCMYIDKKNCCCNHSNPIRNLCYRTLLVRAAVFFVRLLIAGCAQFVKSLRH